MERVQFEFHPPGESSTVWLSMDPVAGETEKNGNGRYQITLGPFSNSGELVYRIHAYEPTSSSLFTIEGIEYTQGIQFFPSF